MSSFRADAHPSEDLDADLADAVSAMLLAVAADLKTEADRRRPPAAVRKHIGEAAIRLIAVADWLGDDPVTTATLARVTP